MHGGRWAVVCLWLSAVARVAGDNALRFFVVLVLFYAPGGAYRDSAWYLVTALFMAPAVLLAPVNGALANTLPKPLVLIAAAGLSLLATALAAVFLGPADAGGWLLCWVFVAIAAAVYGPTRYALLPAAADDTGWLLTRLNGAFETGAAAAVVGGMALAVGLSGTDWADHRPAFIAAFGVAALAFAAPVRFRSDVRRSEGAWRAVHGFFTDTRAILAAREPRVCLLGLALLRGVVTGLTGALLPRVLSGAEPSAVEIAEACRWLAWIMAGLATGAVLTGLQRHPRRVLGLVPCGGAGLAVGLAWSAVTDVPGPLLLFSLGLMNGLIMVPLAATYQAELPADARGNGMAVRNFADYVVVAASSLALYVLAHHLDAPPALLLVALAAVCGIAAVYAVWFFRREVGELLIEGVFLVMYRFRTAGPGRDVFPRRGPVLVIANHTAWLDPPWLAKVLPRPLVAMMTSTFFDLPVLRWLMVNVTRAIRVQASGFRRDVPELRAAVAALDRGDCLLVFPEGGMRRTDERPLRMFGQGAWHILRERPETPVVFCWIEGGWGSYFSYQGGPPTKHKRPDLRRLIQVAVGAAQPIPADVLADQRRTRLHLMRECLDMRRHLGLEAFDLAADTIEPVEDPPTE